MSDFRIGPMKLVNARVDGPGWMLWRGEDFAGYFRDESEGRRVAIGLSYLTDAQWRGARLAVLAFYEREAA